MLRACRNVIVFDYTKLGVLVTKGANVLEAVHTWNGGGIGMEIATGPNRLIGETPRRP